MKESRQTVPATPHDAVFAPFGKFPRADWPHRVAAFLLDLMLVTALVGTLLFGYILPTRFGSELEEMETWSRAFWAEAQRATREGEPARLPEMSEELIELFAFIQQFILGVFWAYFGGLPVVLRGATLGKRMVGLSVMDRNTVGSPGFGTCLLRGGIQAFSLILFFPLLLINFLAAFFFRHRLALHDLAARTIVVSMPPDEAAGEKGET
ncbi:MAG: RDD family protein [Opitutales bacterium]